MRCPVSSRRSSAWRHSGGWSTSTSPTTVPAQTRAVHGTQPPCRPARHGGCRRGRGCQRVRRPPDRPLPCGDRQHHPPPTEEPGGCVSRRAWTARSPGSRPFRTSVDDFYRVDTRLSLPIVDAGSWELVIDGDVARSQSFSYDDLLAMPMIERDITLTCVSNEVGGPYVGGARWLGVPLTRPSSTRPVSGTPSDQILSTDVDGMTISTPLALATDGRDAMIAVGMNGEPLPRAHGFPARMVVPGLYGFISACKWINRMTLTTYADHSAYWTERDWAERRADQDREPDRHPAGRCNASRPAAPSSAASPGPSPSASARSRCRSTAAGWQKATLGPSAGHDYWRQWYLRVGREARPAPARLPRHRPRGTRADDRAHVAVPERRERDPEDPGLRHLTHPSGSRAAPNDLRHQETQTGRVTHEQHASTHGDRRHRAVQQLSVSPPVAATTAADSAAAGPQQPPRPHHHGRRRPSGPAAAPSRPDGAGSFNGMATAPGRLRRQRQPAALDAGRRRHQGRPRRHAQLGQKSLTVFAPTNDAFGKIPPKTLKAVLADKPTLTKILTYHVIAGSPDARPAGRDAQDARGRRT